MKFFLKLFPASRKCLEKVFPMEQLERMPMLLLEKVLVLISNDSFRVLVRRENLILQMVVHLLKYDIFWSVFNLLVF